MELRLWEYYPGIFDSNWWLLRIDLFTVVCLVTCPLNESEAGVDLVMIQTSLLFLQCMLMKSNEVSIKTRSTPASLSFIGPVTKHTTVKWTINFSLHSWYFIKVRLFH